MEQGGISIISPPGITENSVGKSKSIGITLRSSNGGIRSAKEKLKAPWLRKLMKEDASVRETTYYLLGEIIGTGILVLLGCMGCVGSLGYGPELFAISVVFGTAVMIAIQVVGHISGAHINPSVSLVALILGNKSLPMTGMYIVAQCLGATLGYGLLKMLTPSHLLHGGDPNMAYGHCMTDVHRDLSLLQGLLAEAVATGVLAFFVCGVWDPRNARNSDSVPLRFGLCIAALCIVFVPYTGCSLNPARTFGPAVWNGYWTNHWVYWVGPLLGSAIASSIYRFLFLAKKVEGASMQDSGSPNSAET